MFDKVVAAWKAPFSSDPSTATTKEIAVVWGLTGVIAALVLSR